MSVRGLTVAETPVARRTLRGVTQVDANESSSFGKTEAGSVWPVGRAQVTRKLTPYSRVSRIQLYMYCRH